MHPAHTCIVASDTGSILHVAAVLDPAVQLEAVKYFLNRKAEEEEGEEEEQVVDSEEEEDGEEEMASG